MFGRIKTKNVYYGVLCRVTNIEVSGWTTCGKTYYENTRRIVFVKKVCDPGWSEPEYKDVLTGQRMYGDSKRTRYVGDYFVANLHSMCESCGKRTISKKWLKKMQKELNERTKIDEKDN